MPMPGNLLTENHQSIETSIGGWAGFIPGSSSTIRSTTQFFDGAAAIRATSNGTQSAMAGLTATGSAPVVAAGKKYDFSFWVFAPRTITFRTALDWYQSNNTTFISDTTAAGGNVVVPANTWTKVGGADFSTNRNLSPALAGVARLYLNAVSGAVTGDLVYFDTIYFGRPPLPNARKPLTVAVARAGSY